MSYGYPLEFNHFVVLEGFKKDKVYLNDPGTGPRTVTAEEFDRSFTGVTLVFEIGTGFEPGGERPNVIKSLKSRFKGSESAMAFAVLTGLALVIPGLVVPAFSRVFVDNILFKLFYDCFLSPHDDVERKKMKIRHISWLTWNPFDDRECSECKVLPLCMGGCPHNYKTINDNKPDCMTVKNNLKRMVWIVSNFKKR